MSTITNREDICVTITIFLLSNFQAMKVEQFLGLSRLAHKYQQMTSPIYSL